MKCLACDFGGSSVKYAVVNQEADMESTGKIPAPLESEEEFVETVKKLYDQYRKDIDGIAISLPGYINPDEGVLIGSGAYKPLYSKNIVDLLRPVCPLPITVENDGKCAALAEVWKGALEGCKDGAVIILGSAIAGGIIKDGKIHSGRDFAAGEVSFLVTNPEEHNVLGCAFMSAAMHGLTYRMCKAKNLDFVVQDSAILLQEIDSQVMMPYAHPENELKKIKADGVQIFKWLSEGDSDAEEIYKNFIRSLAVVVNNIQVCYSPEKIAIGGGLSLAGRIFEDLNEELEKYYEGMQFGKELRAKVVKSRYLNDCNLIGATYNYIQRIGNSGMTNA